MKMPITGNICYISYIQDGLITDYRHPNTFTVVLCNTGYLIYNEVTLESLCYEHPRDPELCP